MTEEVEESFCSVNECQAREIAFTLLNPRCSDLLEKLIVPRLVKELSTFYGSGKFCYRVHNSPQNVLILRQISQAHVPQRMHLRPLLKFSFHLRLLFPSVLYHSVFPTKTVNEFFISPCVLYVPPISFSLN